MQTECRGFEDEVAELGKKETEAYCDVTIDSLRNTYMRLKNNRGQACKVWIDAHSDEVGYIVQAIKPNGTMNFLTIGEATSPACRQIKCVYRLPPENIFRGSSQANLRTLSVPQKKIKGRYFPSRHHVGATSAQDLKEHFQIRMAAPVVPDVTCTYDEKRDLFMGKAFDCRIGCAALIETLNQLSTETLDVDVEATLTVQEEVGERGSMAAVDNIDADVCIVFEGCPADDTFSPDYLIQAALRRGRCSAILTVR